MDFQKYPYVRKYFRNSRLDQKHPLRNLSLNSEYMDNLENILRELDGTTNLATKIKIMKTSGRSGWDSIFSELDFAKRLKPLKPEFVKESKNGLRTPDIKVNLLGKELFFEVEMLDDTTQHLRIENAFSNNLPCLIMIHGIIYNEKTANGLIEFLKNEISYEKADVYSFEGIGVEVRLTKFPRGIMFGYVIPLERIKKKISLSFNDKLEQFKSHKPIFWVIDCRKFEYSHDSMKFVLYNITEGLFRFEEAKCLNGVIIKIHGSTDLFLNPLVEQRLDDNSIAQLGSLLSAK